jgi:hypothetical protein
MSKIKEEHRNGNCFGILGFLMLLLSIQCNNNKPNWEGGAIYIPGVYTLQRIGYTTTISSERNILHYTVRDKNGQIIIQSNENASILQKWLLYWDEQNNLWVKSADIGDIVWQKSAAGTYKKIIVSEDSSARSRMPQELKINQ